MWLVTCAFDHYKRRDDCRRNGETTAGQHGEGKLCYRMKRVEQNSSNKMDHPILMLGLPPHHLLVDSVLSSLSLFSILGNREG